MAGNTIAEAKMTAHGRIEDGRADFLALKNHYEGVGANAIELQEAEVIIQSLFYSGEKAQMWWTEFEKKLSRAFAIYDKHSGAQVYNDTLKLRTLQNKIQADFLQPAKELINMELSKPVLAITYEHAMTTFRNVVNRKKSPLGLQNLHI